MEVLLLAQGLEVGLVVGDEHRILGYHDGVQGQILLAEQTTIAIARRPVAALVADRHQRGRQALVDPQLHCSCQGRLGRPRRGCALAQMGAISKTSSAMWA